MNLKYAEMFAIVVHENMTIRLSPSPLKPQISSPLNPKEGVILRL